MPPKALDVDLKSRDQRARLPIRTKPYWIGLYEGAHIGYYRGRRARTWVARFRQPGGFSNYQEATIAETDDSVDADGAKILNFEQAQEVALRWLKRMEKTARREKQAIRFQRHLMIT